VGLRVRVTRFRRKDEGPERTDDAGPKAYSGLATSALTFADAKILHGYG
jgi:hypothetical protein